MSPATNRKIEVPGDDENDDREPTQVTRLFAVLDEKCDETRDSLTAAVQTADQLGRAVRRRRSSDPAFAAALSSAPPPDPEAGAGVEASDSSG